MKSNQKQISTFKNTPNEMMFKSRSFVVQQAVDKPEQADLKTSLNQAERYGHHITKSLDTSQKQGETSNQPQRVNQPVIQHYNPSRGNTNASSMLPGSLKFSTHFPYMKYGNQGNAPAAAVAPTPVIQTPVAQTPASAPTNWNNLANQFQPGDKLYGLSKQRPQGAVTNAANNQATVIDQLNNQFLGTSFIGPNSKTFGEIAKNEPTNPGGQQWMDHASYGKPNTMGKPPTNEQIQEASNYKTWLENHPKYSPTTTIVNGEPLSSPFRQWDRTKKSSKAGLEYITKEQQNNVHFILDNLNQQAVVNKLDHNTMRPEQKTNPITGDSQQSITASELRSLYRKQNDLALMDKVKFWQGGQQVPAPWQTNPALWSQYKPKSWGSLGVPPLQ